VALVENGGWSVCWTDMTDVVLVVVSCFDQSSDGKRPASARPTSHAGPFNCRPSHDDATDAAM